MSSLEEIIQLLILYKYYLLFPLSILEGPIVTVLGGFLVTKGIFNFGVAYIILVLGDIIGDLIYYAIGRWGGKPFIHKWGKFFGLNESTVIKTEDHFKNHSIKTLLFGKTQLIGSVILAAAGMTKMPLFKFIGVNLLASMIKTLGIMLIGYYFGHAYNSIDKYFGVYGKISLVIIIGVLIYLFLKKKKKK